MHHFIERRGNEAAQANYVCVHRARRFQNLSRRHHHPEIDYLVVVTLQHDANDVFADVMHVAFDRGHDYARLRFRARRFFRFHEWHQIRHRFFHDAGRLHHLRQKHFAGAKQIAHHAHSSHKRPFDYLERFGKFAARFFGIAFDEIDYALY